MSAGTYRAAVVMLMYIAPLSMFTSSEVIAATFSFAVSPPLNATVIRSPTLTRCSVAYVSPTDIASLPYASASSPETVSRRTSSLYVGSTAVRPSFPVVPSGAVSEAPTDLYEVTCSMSPAAATAFAAWSTISPPPPPAELDDEVRADGLVEFLGGRGDHGGADDREAGDQGETDHQGGAGRSGAARVAQGVALGEPSHGAEHPQHDRAQHPDHEAGQQRADHDEADQGEEHARAQEERALARLVGLRRGEERGAAA